MRPKIEQALSVIARLQDRVRSWMDTTRNLTLLASENREAVIERDSMAHHPLGYVQGIMERIRQEIGADSELEMRIDRHGKLWCRPETPKGAARMEFSPDDYEINADSLAVAVRRVCEGKGIIQPEQAR